MADELDGITVHITYSGAPGAARAFARQMTEEGVVDAIRAEEGNLRYEYFVPMAAADSDSANPADSADDCVLLVDSWADQAALDAHHASPMMGRIAELRERYDLHMQVMRTDDSDSANDDPFVRR